MKDLNHPKVWKEALAGNKKRFSIYFHSKEPMEDRYFKKFRIAEIVPTSWSIHMKAWQVLLREALKDPDNSKFIFLSESCIPLYPLQDIYEEVIREEKTLMTFGTAWWVDDSRVLHEFPVEHRMVNGEWVILNRKHAEMIANDDHIIDIVARHEHDQEGYTATFLSLKNELENVIERKTTYVNWENQNVRWGSPYHFLEQNEENEGFLKEAKKNGCLFARKFAPSYPQKELIKFVKNKPKVALLFLTVKNLHHPEFWKKALSPYRDLFSIYVHSKETMTDEYFKKYRIAAHVPTSWAIHMKAWQELLKEAIKDRRNKRFVFLSESCLPLWPLNEIYTKLFENNKSYMLYAKPWWGAPERTLTEFPEENQWGNHEWIILNRKHAEMIAKDDAVLPIAINHPLDIESYPATFLSLNNELDHVIPRLTTYVNWSLGNPYHFNDASELNMELLEEARAAGCLFARKFPGSFPDQALEKLIER